MEPLDLCERACEYLDGHAGVPFVVTRMVLIPLVSFLMLRVGEWAGRKGLGLTWAGAKSLCAWLRRPREEGEAVAAVEPPSPALGAFLEAIASGGAAYEAKTRQLHADGVVVAFDKSQAAVAEVITDDANLADVLTGPEWHRACEAARARRLEVIDRDRVLANGRLARGIEKARGKAEPEEALCGNRLTIGGVTFEADRGGNWRPVGRGDGPKGK